MQTWLEIRTIVHGKTGPTIHIREGAIDFLRRQPVVDDKAVTVIQFAGGQTVQVGETPKALHKMFAEARKESA